MATPPDSPIEEEVVYELETTSRTFPKPIPVALEDLCRLTKFTRQEIRVMYRGFKAECPEGVVHENSFKDIYAKFFPHGKRVGGIVGERLKHPGKRYVGAKENGIRNFQRRTHLGIIGKSNSSKDSSLYAHYVFKAFDVNCNGAISFRDHIVTLSTLLRGSVYERLKWTFKLYDLNGDGCISRGELAEVVTAVHELMGKRIAEDDKKTKDQVDRVFKKLDLNQDGVITIEEFLEACLKDDLITKSLEMFDKGL